MISNKVTVTIIVKIHVEYKMTKVFSYKVPFNTLEKAYENITDTSYPDWNDDKPLMNWLNELSNIKK